MQILDNIERITNSNLILHDIKCCLVDASKKPYTVKNELAKPNMISDFVSFDALLDCDKLESFKGIGISIQASNISAIDIDDCFSIVNDVSSGDDRAKYALELFKNLAYCEFSFSGNGLRILFNHEIIEKYAKTYYIKNSIASMEFYQPDLSYRYVTITGNSIYDNQIQDITTSNAVRTFLNEYMIRPKQKMYDITTDVIETRTLTELLVQVKRLYFKHSQFQNLWFSIAPGSGFDESERDYKFIAYLYENITQDKEMLRQIFETSPYFKSKDFKHKNKWLYSDYRYYEYVYSNIRSKNS